MNKPNVCKLGLGLAAALLGTACDAGPEPVTGAPAADPTLPAVTVDAEGDQVTNLLARVQVGSSVVYFAEPEPGAIFVGQKWRRQRLVDPESTPQDIRAMWRALSPGQPMPVALERAVEREEARGVDLAARADDAQRELRLAARVRGMRSDDPGLLEAAPPCDIVTFYKTFCWKWGSMPVGGVDACDFVVNPEYVDRTFINANDVKYGFAGTCSEDATFGWTVQYRKLLSWTNLIVITVDPGEYQEALKRAVNFDFDFRIKLLNNGGGRFHMMYYVSTDPSDQRGLGSEDGYNIPADKPLLPR